MSFGIRYVVIYDEVIPFGVSNEYNGSTLIIIRL